MFARFWTPRRAMIYQAFLRKHFLKNVTSDLPPSSLEQQGSWLNGTFFFQQCSSQHGSFLRSQRQNLLQLGDGDYQSSGDLLSLPRGASCTYIIFGCCCCNSGTQHRAGLWISCCFCLVSTCFLSRSGQKQSRSDWRIGQEWEGGSGQSPSSWRE